MKKTELKEHPLNVRLRAERGEVTLEQIVRRMRALEKVAASLELQELIADIVEKWNEEYRNVIYWIAEALHDGFEVYDDETVEETYYRLWDDAISDKAERTDSQFKIWLRSLSMQFEPGRNHDSRPSEGFYRDELKKQYKTKLQERADQCGCSLETVKVLAAVLGISAKFF